MKSEAFVNAPLNYTVDNGIRPTKYFYEPDASVTLNPAHAMIGLRRR